uniref:Nucleoporin_C domain-containing protein n=1 Tax=Heterorhabditis bacteriophora TaxID=37862 RepID=A0A1I7X7R9_HETBA
MSSDDELAHAAVFRWMLERNMANLILQSKSPFVEQFLTHEISSGRGQRYLDLLWRFYEKSGNYDKASILLSRLADNDNEDISLSQRFAYLSHAIICAQAGSDANTKAAIQDLRDKVEVAHIQMAIKDSIDVHSPKHQDLVKLLDGPILSLQELLVKFAGPFELYKIQLAIFHCANLYNEERLIAVWENIIQSEFKYEGEVAERLLCSLHDLHAIYGQTNYFPTEFVLRRVLELGSGFGCRSVRSLAPGFFVSLIGKIDLNLSKFLKFLTDEYRSGDPWWTSNEPGQRYIMEVGIAVIESFLENSASYTPHQRKEKYQSWFIEPQKLIEDRRTSYQKLIRNAPWRVDKATIQHVSTNGELYISSNNVSSIERLHWRECTDEEEWLSTQKPNLLFKECKSDMENNSLYPYLETTAFRRIEWHRAIIMDEYFGNFVVHTERGSAVLSERTQDISPESHLPISLGTFLLVSLCFVRFYSLVNKKLLAMNLFPLVQMNSSVDVIFTTHLIIRKWKIHLGRSEIRESWLGRWVRFSSRKVGCNHEVCMTIEVVECPPYPVRIKSGTPEVCCFLKLYKNYNVLSLLQLKVRCVYNGERDAKQRAVLFCPGLGQLIYDRDSIIR